MSQNIKDHHLKNHAFYKPSGLHIQSTYKNNFTREEKNRLCSFFEFPTLCKVKIHLYTYKCKDLLLVYRVT